MTLDGQTTSSFISGLSVLEDAFSELASARNILFHLKLILTSSRQRSYEVYDKSSFLVKETKNRMLNEKINFVASDERLVN